MAADWSPPEDDPNLEPSEAIFDLPEDQGRGDQLEDSSQETNSEAGPGGYDLVNEPAPPAIQRVKVEPTATPAPSSPRERKMLKEVTTARWLDRLDRKGLAAAGVGAAILVVLLIIGVSLPRGRPGGVRGREGNAGGGKADVPSGSYVVIDSPIPAVQPHDTAAPPALFAAVPSVEPAHVRAPESRRASSPSDDEAQPQAATKERAAPRWDVPSDPRPEGEAHRYPADLRITLERTLIRDQTEMIPPVLADRDGPYALFAPRWTERAYWVASERAQGKSVYVLKEKPQSPAPIVDLRTGETVGEFSWKSPFWNNPRLSRDATYLVGPDAAPYWVKSQTYPHLGNPEPNTLFVWKQKLDEPIHKLRVRGIALWAEFVSDDRLVLYLITDKSALQVWDVAEGKVVADIPLTIEPFKIPNVPTEVPEPWAYLPST
jgi:hypothetical protein